MYLEYLVDSHLRGSYNLDSWHRTASCIYRNCRRSRSTARWRRPSNLKRETCLVGRRSTWKCFAVDENVRTSAVT